MKRVILFLALLLLLLLPQAVVGAAETYEYAGMWPALQQPWYFNSPNGITTDSIARGTTGILYFLLWNRPEP